MHTANLMKTHEFAFTMKNQECRFADILHNPRKEDRLGIVSMTPGDSLTAAPLLLAAIGDYYETLRQTESDFFLYPEFFVFHVGDLQCYHNALDIWPQSKEVVVAEDPQALLSAINDRGIHHLILPNADRTSGKVMMHAVQAASRRLKTVMTAGEHKGDVSVSPSEAAARMIALTARRSSGLLGDELVDYWTTNAHTVRYYAYIDVENALEIISSAGKTDPYFGFSEKYRTDGAITKSTLAQDTFQITQAR